MQEEGPTSQYVEVIGRVSRTGNSILQHALLPLGDDLGLCDKMHMGLTVDLSLVEHLVKLTPQFPSLFAE